MEQLFSATVAASVIAAVVALVIAVVNAKAARSLAIDTAHRKHRKTSVEPIIDYSRTVTQHIGKLRRIVWRGPSWNEVEAALPQWERELTHINDLSEPLFTSDADLLTALNLLRKTADFTEHCTSMLVYEKFSPEKRQEMLSTFCEAAEGACQSVELASEAYVYRHRGGARDVRRAIKRAAETLAKAVEQGEALEIEASPKN
jgi:hypothetical protein